MEINTINNLIYALAMTICIVGVYQDIKERKFSNYKTLILIGLGLISAHLMGRGLEGIVLFTTMNILGVFMSFLGIFGASDWKLFSSMCLFIPFENMNISIIFILVFIITAILMKVHYTNKGHLKEAFKDEWKALKVFIFTKQKLAYDATSNTYKSETVPLTMALVPAFIISIFILI